MTQAEPHFDCAGLLREVHSQELGLRISTNNPEGFKRVLYKHMRQHPAIRVHIFAAADAPNALLLLKKSPEELGANDGE